MNNIEQLLKEWQQLQPLKPEDQKRLDDKFHLEFNYNSNHIEGNTLTYGQTKLLLIFGETTGDAKMRDYEEMKAHNVGLRWIEEMAKKHTHQLTERDIRDLNKIILVEDYWKVNPKNGSRYQIKVGVYKTRPNSVITATGEEFHYASPEETPVMMYELISWLNKEMVEGNMSPIELASMLHYRYIRIHPFEDGNGRIARLLVTYVLERFGYPMIIIKSEDKENYLRALNQSDVNVGLSPSDGTNAGLDDIWPFLEYMKRQLEWSLFISIKAAKGEDIEESRDWEKKLTLLKRAKKTDEEVSIYRSPEAIKTVVSESIYPLLKTWDQMMKKFEPLLSKIDIFAYINRDTHKYVFKDNANEMFNDFFSKGNKIELHCSLQLIPQRKGQTVGVNGQSITIDFENNYWSITTPTGSYITRLYSQTLTNDEIKEIINQIGTVVYDIIEKTINTV